MTHVVTDGCRDCRFTECVSVCPVECFHYDERMTYIDPDVCIDCGGCVPVCPVGAIVDSIHLDPELHHCIEINQSRSKRLPVLTQRLLPLGTAGAQSPSRGANDE